MQGFRDFIDTFEDCTLIIHDDKTNEILYDEREWIDCDRIPNFVQKLWDKDAKIKSYLVAEDVETDEYIAEIWI